MDKSKVLLTVAVIAFVGLAPGVAQALWAALPEHLLEAALAGAVSTAAVLGLVYVISGAKNENTRRASRFRLPDPIQFT